LGVEIVWQDSVLIALANLGVGVLPITHEKYNLIVCNENVVINLISLENHYAADELIALQSAYQLRGLNLVQLWEDIWHTRQKQVLGRIKSILGLNKRMHGRKGVISVIDQKQADDFLNTNHIQGTAKAKYKFALTIDGQIVAVACFSSTRPMTRIAADYQSVELIRFATLIGVTVTGGFTKLLKHFIKLLSPHDVMSYADRDWSLGNAYEQSGFQLVGITPPMQICLHKNDFSRSFPHRVDQATDPNGLLPVFNTGNLKYILYLK
jgi:hypothetical protein